MEVLDLGSWENQHGELESWLLWLRTRETPAEVLKLVTGNEEIGDIWLIEDDLENVDPKQGAMYAVEGAFSAMEEVQAQTRYA